MNDENEVLYAHAVLGTDAKEFMDSELGRTLVGLATQERDEAMEQLKTVWAWRKNRIRELQAIIWRCDSFESWLGSLVTAGRVAIEELHERE